jgi:type VI secretion system protein ImpG
MDPRLLRLYSEELTHLREVGSEFAREFPKIASRLSLDGMEVTDPYVERLLEGFAFMAARVQLKIDAEQPRLIAHLLESIHPNFLAPVPSMMVARLAVDTSDPNLAKGHPIPRGSALQTTAARGQDTRCEFRTAHEVTLWPIEVTAVQYAAYLPDLPLNRVAPAQGMKGALRIRLRCGGGLTFDQLGIDRLVFHISAGDDIAYRLHELVLGQALGTWVSGDAGRAAQLWRSAADSLRPVGFESTEALLPESLRTFSGHRLLQEVAALPQRALFFEIGELAPRLSQVAGDEAELVIAFSRAEPTLESLVDASCLALNCTPAINLFAKRLDRVSLADDAWEYHVVADRTRPMDFEVHSLIAVVGHGTGRQAQRDFLPLYATFHDTPAEGHGYFTVRREPRLLSERQRQQGPRSTYIGEEVFVALVDGRHGPFREDTRQLSVQAWVTNRDLPLLVPTTGTGTWKLDAPGPVTGVQVLRGPTRPQSRAPSGELGWQMVSLLTLNHLSLSGESPEQAAKALRSMLKLFGPSGDGVWSRQVEGVRSLAVKPVVRRLPFKGPLTFGSGIDVEIELDELSYQGSSAFLFASVLERHFARHAAINSFVTTTLRSAQRGVLMRWRPRIGQRETV